MQPENVDGMILVKFCVNLIEVKFMHSVNVDEREVTFGGTSNELIFVHLVNAYEPIDKIDSGSLIDSKLIHLLKAELLLQSNLCIFQKLSY